MYDPFIKILGQALPTGLSFVKNYDVNFLRAQVLLQDNEKEREVLRREVARSQDQVRHLIGRCAQIPTSMSSFNNLKRIPAAQGTNVASLGF
jgi:hypothetical protein